jgi:hypothetical protein
MWFKNIFRQPAFQLTYYQKQEILISSGAGAKKEAVKTAPCL